MLSLSKHGRGFPALAGAALACQVVAAGAQAPCATTADCLRALESAQRETQTITARFVQTKRISLLDEPLVSSGRFVFKRPDRVRWELEQPQKAIVIIDGSTVRVPGLPEAERQAMGGFSVPAAMTHLGALFTGSAQVLEQHFEATAREESGVISVHLVPRDESWRRAFRHIDVSFLRPALLIAKMTLENALGDSVEIAFHDVARNAPVADELFAADGSPGGRRSATPGQWREEERR